jgi:hypothetical protein
VVLKRLRADWRRGRALAKLKLGERQYWEWDSETEAGTLCANLTFWLDDDLLVLTFHEIWAKDVEGERGRYRANLGLPGARRFMGIVADLAADAGFQRMRIGGQRMTHRRTDAQRVVFDVDRFRRRQSRRR